MWCKQPLFEGPMAHFSKKGLFGGTQTGENLNNTILPRLLTALGHDKMAFHVIAAKIGDGADNSNNDQKQAFQRCTPDFAMQKDCGLCHRNQSE